MSWYDTALAGWYRSKIASADALGAGIDKFAQGLGQAIQGFRQNKMADELSGQMANSGTYAPRAAMVNPGSQTGDMSSNPSNPYGVNPATQGAYPGTNAGSAPIQVGGGVQGLQMRMAIQNMKNQQANQQSEIAARNAQIPYYQAHTRYMNEQTANIPTKTELANERIQQKRQQEQDKLAEKNMDSPDKLKKEIEDIAGPGKAQSILNAPEGGHQGRVVNGQWQNDPNGNMFSPDAKAAQNGVSADGLTIVPMDQLTQWRNRMVNMPKPGQGPTSGNSGMPTFNTPDEARQAVATGKLKSGDKFMTPQGPMQVP